MANLLIVESPAKAKTIEKYLGEGWEVKASLGHVRDLPENEMAVSVPDFRPSYTWTGDGKSVCEMLKRAANRAISSGGEVYLGSDDDREGEAISWHLQQILGLQNPKRIRLGEITKKGVLKAVSEPATINVCLVAAQEARRIVDRFVGYMVSPFVQELLGRYDYSAGRVQSIAVRLVVDRENQIQSHSALAHYGATATFEGGWKASWDTGKEKITDKELALTVASIKKFKVLEASTEKSKSAPFAPFITSTLQQAASNALNIRAKKCMDAAQKLYEGGHITYMRTDNPNLTDDMIAAVRAYSEINNLPLPETARYWKAKDGAQEAHKGIHPTDINVLEAGETEDEKALYKLIWKRTVACQLADAEFLNRKLVLGADLNGAPIQMIATQQTLVTPGYKVLLSEDQAEDNESEATEPNIALPLLEIGEYVSAVSNSLDSFKTKAAKRYSEATLVKELEKNGIGRPSSFAAIMESITKTRKYLRIKKGTKFFEPTERGQALAQSLTGRFSFMEVEFTRELEIKLDLIASNKARYKEVLSDFYSKLNQELESAQKNLTPLHQCPLCARGLLLVQGDKKEFFGCRGFFDKTCKGAFPAIDGKPVFPTQAALAN